jgi:hypothetical protein
MQDEGVERMNQIQNRDQWQALMNATVDIQVPQKTEFLDKLDRW